MDKIEHIPIASEEPFYSFHAFLFPFEWQDEEVPQRATLEDKNKLDTVLKLMGSGGHWQRRSSWEKPTSVVQYNEANYFYDFVRPVLYDTNDDKTLQAHYYHKTPQNDTEYVIRLSGGREYRLEVDDIVVSFYKMGVGVLAFHLYNRQQNQSSPADILAINQYGRRLYPPFLGAPMDKLGTQAFFEYDDWAAGLDGPKYDQIPASIHLETNGNVWAKEEYLAYHKAPDLEEEPGLIQQLLPAIVTKRLKLNPVLDDRMFVLSWYGHNEYADQLKKNYGTNSWWYRYIFVDGGAYASCANEGMLETQLNEHSYHRWTKNGTFYGASRYSFVCLTQQLSSGFFPKLLCSHVQTIYYKVVLLCLIQRACLMRFSAEVTDISRMKARELQLGRKVSSLYKQYLRFVNRIYFREVTAQEQGIELYDLIQSRMRLAEHVKDLEGEIEELHNYVSMLEEENRNDKLDLLTYIGAFFVVPSFIATYLALFGEYSKTSDLMPIAIICLGSSVIAYLIIRTKGIARWVFIVLLLVLMAYVTFIFP
jgi:hypothetical protein